MTIQLWQLSYNNSLKYSFAVCLELHGNNCSSWGNPSAGYLGNTLWRHAIQTVAGRAPTNPQVASPFTEFSMSTGWPRQVYTSINEQFISINIQHSPYCFSIFFVMNWFLKQCDICVHLFQPPRSVAWDVHQIRFTKYPKPKFGISFQFLSMSCIYLPNS